MLGKCIYNALPFEVRQSKNADENFRLKYRYLDLRNPEVKDKILLRSRIVAELRQRMNDLDFIEVTTPILTCSSPEVDTNDKLSKDYFARQINEVREASRCKDEEVSGVIYGGLAYDINNPLSENSCNMVDTFEAACQAEGVKPTIITGRNSADLGNFSAYIGEEQLTLWGDLINKIDLTKKASEKQIIKFLERLFEYVKIPENTAVKIIDDYNGTTKYLSKLEEK